MANPVNLFKGSSPPAPPPPPAPVPLPDPQDPAILAERRRQLSLAAGRAGRASTVLYPNEDYSGTKTGTP